MSEGLCVLNDHSDCALNVRIGPKQHISSYKMHDSDLFNMVFIAKETRDPSKWRDEEYPSEVKECFEGWDSALVSIYWRSINTKSPFWRTIT